MARKPTLSIKDIMALQKIYRRAEQDIINELARLRSRGLIDYHAVAALTRVQKILRDMQQKAGEYVPRIVERYFYANHPDLYTRVLRTAAEHQAGYERAAKLTMEEIDITERLENSVMQKLSQASAKVQEDLTGTLLGRQAQDIFREKGLEMVARQQSSGMALSAKKDFVEELQRNGITAFVDKAGRNWSLSTYADMVTRTTARQAEVSSVLTKYGDRDLFKISKHYGACKLCASYEGRVYSKSGTHPVFPPLSDAFGKIDPNGPNTLSNSYLNIHPNCMHVLLPWSSAGKSEEELREIERFSNPKTNPYDRDPRSEAEIEEYRRKEEGREKILQDIRQWEKYRLAVPDKVPKSFQTFLKHKLAGDDKYEAYVRAYEEWSRYGR